MKEKQMFLDALSTLLHSWGGDTPSEAYWTFYELIEWYEKEYSVKLNLPELKQGEFVDWDDFETKLMEL
jgi:hypothetical protein